MCASHRHHGRQFHSNLNWYIQFNNLKKLWIYVEAIRKFSEEPWSEIAPVDQNLKCYMHCFFRTLIEHEWSHEQLNSEISELDVDNWFTEEEIDALSNMDELCDTISLEEATGNDCEHAYTVVSCLKKANEEVSWLQNVFCRHFSM